MFEGRRQTRSENTKKRYEARYATLRRRFRRDAGASDPNEIVAMLVLAKPTMNSARTSRQYKAAVLHFINEHAPPISAMVRDVRRRRRICADLPS